MELLRCGHKLKAERMNACEKTCVGIRRGNSTSHAPSAGFGVSGRLKAQHFGNAGTDAS